MMELLDKNNINKLSSFDLTLAQTDRSDLLIQNVRQVYEHVLQLLQPNQSGSRVLVDESIEQLKIKVSQLTEQTVTILTFAGRYDCDLVPANGFFSFGKLSLRFLQLIEHNFERIESRNRVQHISSVFIQAIDSFLEITKCMIQQHEAINIGDVSIAGTLTGCVFDTVRFANDANQNEITKLPLFTFDLDHFQTLIRTAISHQTPRVSLMHHFGVFWLDQSMNNFFNLYSFLIPFSKLTLARAFECLWNRKFRFSKYIELVRSPSFEMPFAVWNLTESVFYRRLLISVIHLRTKVKSHTVSVVRQDQLFVSANGLSYTRSDLCQSSKRNQVEVRCRLTLPINSNDQSIDSFDQLLLHFHGGGFVAHSPDSHETYIRSWSNEANTPVLSVDYSLCKAFPTALQEAFDVYYWLRTAPASEVRQKLGFYPKQIVFIGDSAGGNLSLSLAVFTHHLLIEHRTAVPESFRLPDGVIGVYGAFLLLPLISGSRILNSVDTLINPEILLFLMSVYSGAVQKPKPKPRTWAEILNPFHRSTNELAPLWNEEGVLNLDLDEIVKITSSPFLSPLLYSKINEITEFPLKLITAEFCPFLDESITIAKFWKGPIQIDVLENLNHGFLNFNILCRRAQEGVDLCSLRISELLKEIRT